MHFESFHWHVSSFLGQIPRNEVHELRGHCTSSFLRGCCSVWLCSLSHLQQRRRSVAAAPHPRQRCSVHRCTLYGMRTSGRASELYYPDSSLQWASRCALGQAGSAVSVPALPLALPSIYMWSALWLRRLGVLIWDATFAYSDLESCSCWCSSSCERVAGALFSL